MTEIFVEVCGGVLVESYSNDRDVIVRVIDWDNIGDWSEPAIAGTIPCLPLDRMPEETLAATGLKPQNINSIKPNNDTI